MFLLGSVLFLLMFDTCIDLATSLILLSRTVLHHRHLDSVASSVARIHITSITFGTKCLPLLPSFSTRDSPSCTNRWKPFDPTRNWPDLGKRFKDGEAAAKAALLKATLTKEGKIAPTEAVAESEILQDDKRDLDWSAVLKRTFEAYIREERPNMYGEWLRW